MLITPWSDLQLSAIRSNAIELNRLKEEPVRSGQDAYFAVLLLAGEYNLEQSGRRAILRPGDMVLYDAARPHRVFCPNAFGKLIVSIPRERMRERISEVEHCTARPIPGHSGIGAIPSRFLHTISQKKKTLSEADFTALSATGLELLTLAIGSVHPTPRHPKRSRAFSLIQVKRFIASRLPDPSLDAAAVAASIGLSSRYVNYLFEAEGTSLMRYVWNCRLEQCRRDMSAREHSRRSIAALAFRWGFSGFRS